MPSTSFTLPWSELVGLAVRRQRTRLGCCIVGRYHLAADLLGLDLATLLECQAAQVYPRPYREALACLLVSWAELHGRTLSPSEGQLSVIVPASSEYVTPCTDTCGVQRLAVKPC
jgi:hypothetical protein